MYIGFSTTNDLLSRLIRKITGAPYSHTYAGITINGNVFVLDANTFGVRLIPEQLFLSQDNIPIIKIFPKGLDETRFTNILLSKLGTATDYEGMFGAGFTVMGRWIQKKIHNPLLHAHAVFCSELITECLQEAGYRDAATSLVAGDTTPQDLCTWLTNGA